MTLADEAVAALDDVVGSLPGGEPRSSQRAMVSIVADAMESGGHAMVQAGTGVGKSLAYLVPTVLSGKRTVIATATRTLQDQLARKDLPFVVEHLGADVDCAVLKGRGNYLCLQRLDEARSADSAAALAGFSRLGDVGALDRETLEAVSRAAARSGSGERSDLGAGPDGVELGDRVWRSLSVTRSECPGARRCPHGGDCFAEHARDAAAAADVVIVNLHLFGLLLAFPDIIGDYEVAVVDEAHALEGIVSSVMSRRLTPGQFAILARGGRALKADSGVCDAVEETGTLLRDRLGPLVGRLLRDGVVECADVLNAAAHRVSLLAEDVTARIDEIPLEAQQRAQRLVKSARSLLENMNALQAPGEDDIVWVDGSKAAAGGAPALCITPLRIDEMLAESLWSRRSAVLTSATIPPALRESVGLPGTAVAEDVGSPFDYRRNAMLYCPPGLPVPGRRDPRGVRHRELAALIEAAQGRTLALYTSYRAMHAAAAAVRARLRWPVLVQNTESRAALLEEFASDEHASLFATLSFWQGVDVPGRSCTLVVIDKLPFPRPDDPVHQARRDRAGPDAFRLIDLSEAATLLAQGAGRLVRTARDRGVVAVLDPRLAKRHYRRVLLEMLPPMRRTVDRGEATDFLRATFHAPEPPIPAADSIIRGGQRRRDR